MGEQAFQYPIKIEGRLVTPEQFSNIAIKSSNGKGIASKRCCSYSNWC